MLYLLHSDGSIEELAEAAYGALNEQNECFICFDGAGQEVARYPRLAITLFSDKPFPKEAAAEVEIDPLS